MSTTPKPGDRVRITGPTYSGGQTGVVVSGPEWGRVAVQIERPVPGLVSPLVSDVEVIPAEPAPIKPAPYPVEAYPGCPCKACVPADANPFSFHAQMHLCPACGNKRCPGAANHANECTGSNEPGQPGSLYAEPEPAPVVDTGLRDRVALAIGDPGAILSRDMRDDRRGPESVSEWSTRAVLAVVAPALAERDSLRADMRIRAGALADVLGQSRDARYYGLVSMVDEQRKQLDAALAEVGQLRPELRRLTDLAGRDDLFVEDARLRAAQAATGSLVDELHSVLYPGDATPDRPVDARWAAMLDEVRANTAAISQWRHQRDRYKDERDKALAELAEAQVALIELAGPNWKAYADERRAVMAHNKTLFGELATVRAALSDALEGLREMVGYVTPHFREKWALDEYITRAEQALGSAPDGQEGQA